MDNLHVATGLEIRETGDPFEVWCRKCNRQVDFFKVETPLQEVPDDRLGMMKKVHTGEIILTVECHGDRWRASSRHGRLD